MKKLYVESANKSSERTLVGVGGELASKMLEGTSYSIKYTSQSAKKLSARTAAVIDNEIASGVDGKIR